VSVYSLLLLAGWAFTFCIGGTLSVCYRVCLCHYLFGRPHMCLFSGAAPCPLQACEQPASGYPFLPGLPSSCAYLSCAGLECCHGVPVPVFLLCAFVCAPVPTCLATTACVLYIHSCSAGLGVLLPILLTLPSLTCVSGWSTYRCLYACLTYLVYLSLNLFFFWFFVPCGFEFLLLYTPTFNLRCGVHVLPIHFGCAFYFTFTFVCF
jgi:hypothetical protein